MYPKTQKLVHGTGDMYPKTAKRVHIDTFLPYPHAISGRNQTGGISRYGMPPFIRSSAAFHTPKDDKTQVIEKQDAAKTAKNIRQLFTDRNFRV